MDQKKAFQYELSSVELNADHIINVDQKMSMPLDLIDRDVFLPFPKAYQESPLVKAEVDPAAKAREEKELEELRHLYLEEKDKFLLADRPTFEIEVKPQSRQEKRVKLPSRYEIVDKVNKWGEDIRNPTAVRQLDQETNLENETVLTLKEERGKRDIAIKQIERRFEQSKRIKVGMDKGPEHPGVYATEVLDFIPFFHLAANKTQLVVCDDNIDNELPHKKRTPNDFMLR